MRNGTIRRNEISPAKTTVVGRRIRRKRRENGEENSRGREKMRIWWEGCIYRRRRR